MRKVLLYSLLVNAWCLTSCNTATPENYFERAVLSCNTLHGFAGDGLQRELESPSVEMINGNKDQFAPMKRGKIVDERIAAITSNLAQVKNLKSTSETKELLDASLALYDFVLPVYENEYRELARLYDDGASEQSIRHFVESIHTKYYSEYEELYNKLVAAGKPYAARHQIPVNWDVRTSPAL